MKKIVHYTSGVYLTITAQWIYGQIKNLKEYNPIVYCNETDNLDIFPTACVRSLKLKHKQLDLWTIVNKTFKKVFKFDFPFVFLLKKDKPDLIHAHFGGSGYYMLILKRIFRTPLITTFYGYDLSMLPNQFPEWKRRYKKLFKYGDCFLVEGYHMKKCLVEMGCPAVKVVVQHLGVDLDNIKFAPRKLLNTEQIKILIAASFREKKGIPYAIKCLGILLRNNPTLGLKVTIIGDSGGQNREEQEKKKILDLIEEYSLNNTITMLGYQPYPVFISELYKHHIFLSPSVTASDGDTEGGAPVSLIDASASGMPILSTLHCDIPEVVLNGKTGYLVPERDVEALIEKLKLLIHQCDKWGEMGSNGRKHIERKYNVKEQVRRLEGIYDRVLNNF